MDEGVGFQGLIAKEFVTLAVKFVRARLDSEVDNSSSRRAVLRGITAGTDREFLKRIRARSHFGKERSVLGAASSGAVDQNVRITGLVPGNAELRSIGAASTGIASPGVLIGICGTHAAVE